MACGAAAKVASTSGTAALRKLLTLLLTLLLVQATPTVSGQRFGRPQQQPYPDKYYPQGHQAFPEEPYPAEPYPQQPAPYPRPGGQRPGQHGGRRPGPGLSSGVRPGFGTSGGAVEGGLGAPCDYDVDCASSMDHTYCRAQQSCECKLGFVASAAGDRCLATVGARCSDKYDCSGLGAAGDCVQGVCDCGDAYVPAADGSCLRGAQKLNEECEEQIQCQTLGEGTVCVNGRCACGLGTHGHRDKCLATRALHEHCTEDAECNIGEGYPAGNVTCSTGSCRCRENYEEVDGKCASGANNVYTVLTSVFLIFIVHIF